MNPRAKYSNAGFTLIESIIAIVILAFIAAMMTAYFSVGITHSHDPFERLNAGTNLNVIMANITAQYRQIPHSWKPDTHYTQGTIILPGVGNWQNTHNGFSYIATSASWTSGTNKPQWTTHAGDLISDNSGTWQCTNDTNLPPRPLIPLQTTIGTEGSDVTTTFGTYHVVQNRFIKFDAGNTETNIDSTPTDLAYGYFLKVTIGHASNASNRTNETLTSLFVMN